MSPEISRQESQCQLPGARAALIMAWRNHPDVLAYCAGRAFESWEVFRDDTIRNGTAWSVPNRERLWHFAATYYRYGLGGLSDDARKIIVDEHPDGGDIDPPASRWLVVEDTHETSPAYLPASWDDAAGAPSPAYVAAATAWATDYRARLPEGLRHLGLVVLPEPGEHPIVGIWVGAAHPPEVLRKWIRRLGGGSHDDESNDGRFIVRSRASASGADFVAVEPASVQHASISELRAAMRTSGAVTPTGIRGLDTLIRLGGTDAGGLTVFVAQEKNCKTLSMLQVAEHRASIGRCGVWVARDETEPSIQKRRWQYRGLSEADARARVAGGEVVDDQLAITSVPLDKVLEVVSNLVAQGTPTDLYLDSLNGDATGQHDIDQLVRRLKATGADLFVTAEGTSVRSGAMRVKGSTGVAFAADLTVALRFDGKSALKMRVSRSRIANDGEIAANVDTAGQRLVTEVPADDLAAAKAAILATLQARGPLSGAGIERWVPGDTRNTRRALAALVGVGVLAHVGRTYRARVSGGSDERPISQDATERIPPEHSGTTETL